MKTTPYAHQLVAYETSRDSEFFAFFMEMGTGKTKPTIDTICHLYQQGKITGALVIAPKGAVPAWTVSELPAHMWNNVPAVIVQWDPAKTKKALSLFDSVARPLARDKLRILVMNIEAISTRRGVLAAKDFLIQGPSIMVVDESTTLKAGGTNRSKGALWLAKMAKYRRILTGLPIEQSPMDLYHQCEFLKPGLLGHRSFYSFRGAYADLVSITIPLTGVGASGARRSRTVPKVAGYKNLDRLSTILKGFSYRTTKKECLDLPDKIYQTVEVEMTDQQEKVYDDMRRHAVAALSEEGEQCTALMALTQILRLHQIVCGHLKMDDGTVTRLPHNRITALLSVIEETQGKVVVWATYTHDIEAIEEALSKEYGAAAVCSYYGATPQDVRAEHVTRFQTDPSLRFFIGNPTTGGVGLTLTAAHTMVYYSNSHSVRSRGQSEDRCHRLGQKNAVTYVDLVCPDTVDGIILKAIRFKRELADMVMDGNWKALI